MSMSCLVDELSCSQNNCQIPGPVSGLKTQKIEVSEIMHVKTPKWWAEGKAFDFHSPNRIVDLGYFYKCISGETSISCG